MAKDIYKNDSEAVTKFIAGIDPERAEICQLIREIILQSSDSIDEFIKWNAPAYFYSGEMKPYNPKEYSRDMMVFNARQKDHVLIIMPTGARLFPNILLEGDYPDGRKMIKFYTKAEVLDKKDALQDIVREWIATVE